MCDSHVSVDTEHLFLSPEEIAGIYYEPGHVFNACELSECAADICYRGILSTVRMVFGKEQDSLFFSVRVDYFLGNTRDRGGRAGAFRHETVLLFNFHSGFERV